MTQLVHEHSSFDWSRPGDPDRAQSPCAVAPRHTRCALQSHHRPRRLHAGDHGNGGDQLRPQVGPGRREGDRRSFRPCETASIATIARVGRVLRLRVFIISDLPWTTRLRRQWSGCLSGKAGVVLALEGECKTIIEATGPIGSQILMDNLPRCIREHAGSPDNGPLLSAGDIGHQALTH